MAKDKKNETLMEKVVAEGDTVIAALDVKDYFTNMKMRESLASLGDSPRKITNKFLSDRIADRFSEGDLNILAYGHSENASITELIGFEFTPLALGLGAFEIAGTAPPDGKEVAPAKPVEEILTLLSVDDHFAPGSERLGINYNIKGLKDKTVTLEITSDSYGSNPVYKRELTSGEKSDGTHSINWNGATTCDGGDLKGTYINPLYAPYKVKISGGGHKGEGEFKVLYHSISVELGSYTETEKAPDKSDTIKWVQYKLNELGYFSGPVDGIKGDQTKRAIKRYTYAMPGMTETDDETVANFQDNLDKNKGRIDILEGNRIPKPGEKKKIYINHDYFYEDFATEFTDTQGHGKKDKAKLDRFEIPLEAEILLVSKNDKDGSKPGIKSPNAVGMVEVEWLIKDPVEDTSVLQARSANIPTQSKKYIQDALTATGQVAGKPDDSQDNAPTANNGARGTNKDYFRTGKKLQPFETTASGDKVYTKAHHDKAKSTKKLGKAGVLFRGSYIAGDNYSFKASVSFENHANKSNLEQLHKAFFGKEHTKVLFKESGQMTLWRRQHISATVDWPAPPYSINWGDVRSEYAHAHCDLQTANKSFAISTLFTTAADKNAYLNLVSSHYPALPRASMKFDEQGLYPLELPKQGTREDPDVYEARVSSLVRTFASKAQFQDDLADMIFKKVSKTEKAGIIAFRPNWARPVKVNKLLPIIGVKNPFKSTMFTPKLFCVGLVRGVTLLDNTYTRTIQDRFLVTHEMGHCRYLLHHQTKTGVAATTSDNPNDHDINDHNCTMCYPWGIFTRPGLSWNKGDATQSRFCGKCLLKLRGWEVANGGLPVQS